MKQPEPIAKRFPQASREVPLVSGVIPLVSKVPPVTLARFWGMRPRWRPIPTIRRREITPTERGLLGFLTIVLAAPASIPIKMISNIAKQAAKQADDELHQEAMLRAIRPRPEDEAEMALVAVTADEE